jgi:hypothetical protein
MKDDKISDTLKIEENKKGKREVSAGIETNYFLRITDDLK